MTSQPNPAPPLRLHRLRIHARPITGYRDVYLGSTIRGAFGAALRPRHCTPHQLDCTPCPERAHCPLPALFDNPVPDQDIDPGLLAGYRNAPQPYVLRVPYGTETERPVHPIELTLIGHAADHAAIAESALLEALERRLPGPYRHHIEDIDYPTAPSTPPVPDRVIVHLDTPLQIRLDGHRLDARHFRVAPWITTILRRHSLFRRYYGDGPLELDFAALKAGAESLMPENPELRDHHNRRHSQRRDADMPMHGIHGRFELGGDALASLWPWLWEGQWLHAGRLATMGFGAYRLAPASLPNHRTGHAPGHNTLRLKR